MTIPSTGIAPEAIMSVLHRFKAHDMDWQPGRVFAYVYRTDKAAETVVKDV
ncbi:hypothetical protein [Roseiflexus sp.]|uniref:hypothetical protein n=1 Tax=Roseiflexus sp. TaxID=2562120 RepID=UPI00398B240C